MEKGDLDPWRVIRSVLSRLRSYDVPDVLDRTGLPVDWSLTERQDYSHATRWAAYRPRIDRAYQSLTSDEERLRVAFIVARELAERGLGDELSAALKEIGWELRGNKLAPVGEAVTELFFPERSQHDAYVEIRNLLSVATSSITIIDPYLDDSILTLLSGCARNGTNVRVLTSKHPADLSLELQKWHAQHPTISIEIRTTKNFHDRFVIIDGKQCWHLGASIKDAGSKVFMINEVEDEENRAALVARQEAAWTSAQLMK
jgi:PLD-like domain